MSVLIMSQLSHFAKYVAEKIYEYPCLKDEIDAIFWMAKDSIQEGESEFNEIELAKKDIEELIQLHNNEL